MRTSPRILSILLAFAALLPATTFAQTKTEAKIEAIDRSFIDGLFKLQAAYRKSLAGVLASADKVEVFLLDFEMQDADAYRVVGWDSLPPAFFPIPPYGSKSKILQQKTLSPDQIQKLLPVLQENVGVEANHGGAFCHYPIHGVRLWSGEKLVFQSSFCWACQNFYVMYPDRDAGWVGVSTKELEKVMEELMPIPQKELERFRKKNEPKPAPKKKKK
jgi:hypothetical protein